MPEYVAGQLLVKFKDGTPPEVVNAVLGRVDGEVEGRVKKIDVRVVDVPDRKTSQALAAVEASPAVEYAERDVAVDAFDSIPNDSLWSTQWGLGLVKAPRAWDASRGSSGVVVAVLDTGIASGHPDLQGALVAATTSSTRTQTRRTTRATGRPRPGSSRCA